MTMSIATHSGRQVMSDRELAVLRALGRLGPTRMDHLSTLVLADLAVRTRQALMQRLLRQGLICAMWIGNPTVRADGQAGPPRNHRVFGLTVAGRDQLDAMGAEPDALVRDRLLVSDRSEPSLGGIVLHRDVMVSAWCTAVLWQVQNAPGLVGVRCQAQLVPAHDPVTGQPLQRIGAYMELIFAAEPPPAVQPRWQVPWQDAPMPAESRVLRWGLEFDTGISALGRLVQQAQTYAALQPLYTTVLGGPVTPILLTPSAQRSTRVLQAWREGWPETTALCASVEQAEHPTLGVLWGTYLTVKDDPPQPTYLLRGLVDDPRQDEP